MLNVAPNSQPLDPELDALDHSAIVPVILKYLLLLFQKMFETLCFCILFL